MSSWPFAECRILASDVATGGHAVMEQYKLNDLRSRTMGLMNFPPTDLYNFVSECLSNVFSSVRRLVIEHKWGHMCSRSKKAVSGMSTSGWLCSSANSHHKNWTKRLIKFATFDIPISCGILIALDEIQTGKLEVKLLRRYKCLTSLSILELEVLITKVRSIDEEMLQLFGHGYLK